MNTMELSRPAEIVLKEQERTSADSGKRCPNCDGKMCVGEDEAIGTCTYCYFAQVGGEQ